MIFERALRSYCLHADAKIEDCSEFLGYCANGVRHKGGVNMPLAFSGNIGHVFEIKLSEN